MAVSNGEQDKLIRHLMAQGLAAGAGIGEHLARDIHLLRWVLGKMEENRRTAELAKIAEDVDLGRIE